MFRTDQQGVVLILVLWMIILLTIIALSYNQSTRTETLSTANTVNQLSAMAAAEAGIHLAINDILKSDIEQAWAHDGQIYSTQLDNAKINVSIRNTTGLIDINTASAELFSRLFIAIDPTSDHNSLIDAILDWRDRDDIRRPFGAEEVEYLRSGLKFSAKNGPFNTINELHNVLGMTDILFDKIAPFLTVHSQHNLVNPNYADEELLQLLTDANVDDLEIDNQASTINRQALLSLHPNLFNTAKRNHFKISSIAIVNGSKARLDAIILLAPQGKNPYTLLSWKRNEWLTTSDNHELVEEH